ncbi:peptidoglycan editing factor PgeF [Laceyella putida]|jgi:YfiH family protein|uniref:Purine nucleoside phosphorylase n=1 Tax=Laceyella putida TaxID=110101 RepID=A0ABW2RMT5_9BACL
MEPFQYHDTNVPIFSLTSWQNQFPHITVGFSARRADEDADCRNYALHVGDRPRQVIENRRQLSGELGFALAAWTCAEQVHGVHIEHVTQADRGKGKEGRETAFQDTDGLFTSETDVLLAAYFADCVPLYFYHPTLDLIGVAHAGWKGTVGQIGSLMVKRFCEQGAKPEEILVAIGPSIGPCCYEVDEHVIGPMRKVIADSQAMERIAVNHIPGRWQCDLKTANAEIFLQAGILPEHITVSKWCTSCDHQYFYSHRRDKGKTGRMVAWIGKQER